MGRPPADPYRDERASYDLVGTPHRLDESEPDGLPQQAATGPVGGGVTRLGPVQMSTTLVVVSSTRLAAERSRHIHAAGRFVSRTEHPGNRPASVRDNLAWCRRCRGGSRVVAFRVVLVDDNRDLRIMWRVALECSSRFVVVGEAADGWEALAACREHRPDAVVTDWSMAGLDGAGLARRLRNEHPDIVVVLCSVRSHADVPPDLADLGVVYLDKLHSHHLPDVLTRLLTSQVARTERASGHLNGVGDPYLSLVDGLLSRRGPSPPRWVAAGLLSETHALCDAARKLKANAVEARLQAAHTRARADELRRSVTAPVARAGPAPKPPLGC